LGHLEVDSVAIWNRPTLLGLVCAVALVFITVGLGTAHAEEAPSPDAEEQLGIISDLAEAFDAIVEKLKTLGLAGDEELSTTLTDDASGDEDAEEAPKISTTIRDDSLLETERAAQQGELSALPVLSELSDDQTHAVTAKAKAELAQRFEALKEELTTAGVVEKPRPVVQQTRDTGYYYDDGGNTENCYSQCDAFEYACTASCAGLSTKWINIIGTPPKYECESDCRNARYSCRDAC
jgi:hypothetical protein